ncbi:hypothetical protein [Phenylobacterium sp.]|uniref:hypothetical protein n=1 Tax=Phenylobacterium sp. TaxID=1871053 RepID=UPI003926978D
MNLGHIRRVVLFCPAALTGGPEALHQLSHALTGVGIENHMVYFGGGGGIQVERNRVRSASPLAAEVMEYYAAYAPRSAPEVPRDGDTLMVLPESLAPKHHGFTAGRVAIWWLSVDNAYRAAPRLRDEAFRRELFARPDLIHLWQSAYARDFLRDHGAPNMAELRDYTSPLFTDAPAAGPSPRRACAYNAAKGGDLGAGFFQAHPNLDGLALQGFSKPKLREIFSERLVYVDFGHFPGQDRMPREAAACGAVVFIRRRGAGRFQEDFPLPEDFKFEDAEVESGALAARIEAVMTDPRGHWDAQQPFRDMILNEKRAFQAQAAALFGRAPARP